MVPTSTSIPHGDLVASTRQKERFQGGNEPQHPMMQHIVQAFSTTKSQERVNAGMYRKNSGAMST